MMTRREKNVINFLSKLLPYVHVTTNALVHNPHEIDSSKVIPLTKEDIANITGINVTAVNSKLYNMMLNNEYVFASFTLACNELYLVNPHIFRHQKEISPLLDHIFSCKE
jgi:hypothetical protein